MSKKGQALVEFVIILPIFIFMLLAIIDSFSILFGSCGFTVILLNKYIFISSYVY